MREQLRQQQIPQEMMQHLQRKGLAREAIARGVEESTAQVETYKTVVTVSRALRTEYRRWLDAVNHINANASLTYTEDKTYWESQFLIELKASTDIINQFKSMQDEWETTYRAAPCK